jgi:hypothetical protein
MLNQIKETYSLLGIFTKDAETFVKEYEKTHAEEVPEEIPAEETFEPDDIDFDEVSMAETIRIDLDVDAQE